MGNREAGGVLIALAGAVLIVAGVRGTLGRVWSALWGPGDEIRDRIGTPPADPTLPAATGLQLPPGYPGTLRQPTIAGG